MIETFVVRQSYFEEKSRSVCTMSRHHNYGRDTYEAKQKVAMFSFLPLIFRLIEVLSHVSLSKDLGLVDCKGKIVIGPRYNICVPHLVRVLKHSIEFGRKGFYLGSFYAVNVTAVHFRMIGRSRIRVASNPYCCVDRPTIWALHSCRVVETIHGDHDADAAKNHVNSMKK